MKNFIVSLFIFLCCWLNQAHTQMACKDTVFNISFTQNVCLFNIWGDWEIDSIYSPSENITKPSSRKEVWTFTSELTYSYSFQFQQGQREGTAKYKFIKGFLQLNDYTVKGGRVVSPLPYRVLEISPNRMVVSEKSTDIKSELQIILKKVKN